MNTIIKKAGIEDIGSIAKLYISNWKEVYKGLLPDEFLNHLNIQDRKKKWKTFMEKEKHSIFVAYQENEFLGFTSCKIDDEIENCMYLDSLQVTKQSRGKGIGSKLLSTVGHYSYLCGYKKMSICIVKGNDNARKLYEKLGAKHYKDFIDDFQGTKSQSEKLLWPDLFIFAKNHKNK